MKQLLLLVFNYRFKPSKMKISATLVLLLFCASANAQLTLENVNAAVSSYQIGTYSYHADFIGHAGYGAPKILTADGGAAIIGDYEGDQGRGALLIKLDKNGEEQWKVNITPQFDELEAQSVVQDANGNFYMFLLSYNYEKYRGGSQRIIYLKGDGTLIWDQTMGNYSLVNNPTFSYIRMLDDGRVSLRGHIVKKEAEEGKDPEYHFWEGWINEKKELTQKTGDVIDWSNSNWRELYKPE
jgi:hypothetical protein